MRDRSLKPSNLTTVGTKHDTLSFVVGNICFLLDPALLSAKDSLNMSISTNGSLGHAGRAAVQKGVRAESG
jgi:hypothetical protein